VHCSPVSTPRSLRWGLTLYPGTPQMLAAWSDTKWKRPGSRQEARLHRELSRIFLGARSESVEGEDMKRSRSIAFALMLGATSLVACGDDGDGGSKGSPSAEETTSPQAEASPNRVNIAALDYSFEAPASISAGVVQFAYTNRGKEPHFFGLARIPEGRSLDEVKGALTAPPPAAGPPPGPPPFEDFAGIATADPAVEGEVSFDIPASKYVFYCLIPSPDGVTHANKGMIKELEVTEGAEGSLVETAPEVSLVGTDFAFDKTPSVKAGSNTLRLRNDGRQLHEINLIELPDGQTLDEAVAWHRQMQGPPPFRFLGGVAIKPEEEATTTLVLAQGRTYAFICAIPDVLGDFAPHVTKGMHTETFTVS
jgi:uncharacterized cupredoxin-like copper-binding protein